jgi:hypothetical protein
LKGATAEHVTSFLEGRTLPFRFEIS